MKMLNNRPAAKPRQSFTFGLIWFLVPFLAACGTLEVGVEPTPTTDTIAIEAGLRVQPMTPTPLRNEVVPFTSEPALTPIPVDSYPAPRGLRVAYLRDGDVWLWTADGSGARRVTTAGGADGSVKISDDGELVAFQRREVVWLANSDGASERQLLAPGDLDGMSAVDSGVTLNRFEWVPGTHTMAVNTRMRSSDGSVLNDDLRLVDADTLEQTILLPPGEGGEFYYCPDGDQIAIVTSGDISLVDADGGNRRDSVLTFTPIETHSAYDYYPEPVWAADGSSLLVAIPPVDSEVRPTQHTTVWHIPTGGGRAELVVTVDAFPAKEAMAFSHDLAYVAYAELTPSGIISDESQISLKVVRMETGEWQSFPDVGLLYGWAPNSRRVAFAAGRQTPRLQIGEWSAGTIPGCVDEGIWVYDLRWVDSDHYLFTVRRDSEKDPEGDNYDFFLGDTDGSSTILASTADYPSFDYRIP